MTAYFFMSSLYYKEYLLIKLVVIWGIYIMNLEFNNTTDKRINKSTKKMFTYVVRGEKAKYIWAYAVPIRGLMVVGGISVFIGLVFGDFFNYPMYSLINTLIRLLLSIPVAAISGKLVFEVFEDITKSGHWTKKTVWKYIIGEGVFGYGLICCIVIGEFLPLNIIVVFIEILIWSGIGLIIGIWTRVSWKIEKIKEILIELKKENIY